MKIAPPTATPPVATTLKTNTQNELNPAKQAKAAETPAKGSAFGHAVAEFAHKAPEELVRQLVARHQEVIDRCLAATLDGGVSNELIGAAQDIDWVLHATIIDFLGNAIISEAYRVNSIKIRLIRQQQTTLSKATVLPAMQDHMAILSAIAGRDADAAVAAMQNHITSARKRAMELQ